MLVVLWSAGGCCGHGSGGGCPGTPTSRTSALSRVEHKLELTRHVAETLLLWRLVPKL